MRLNYVIFVGFLLVCVYVGLVEEGRWCFDMMIYIYFIEFRVYYYVCMVDIFSRVVRFDEVEKFIDDMLVEFDVYVWGVLFGGC